MNKLILILLLISFPEMVIQSSPLEEYIWKNRVIVTFSPSKTNTYRVQILNSIHKNLCEFNSRNIIHIDFIFNEKNHEIEKFGSFLKIYLYLLVSSV